MDKLYDYQVRTHTGNAASGAGYGAKTSATSTSPRYGMKSKAKPIAK